MSNFTFSLQLEGREGDALDVHADRIPSVGEIIVVPLGPSGRYQVKEIWTTIRSTPSGFGLSLGFPVLYCKKFS